AFSFRTLAHRKNLPAPLWNTRAHTPAISSPKFFRNGSKGNVAKTGFAEISERAHRTVSELSPVEERIPAALSAASPPLQIFLDATAPHRCAHPSLPSSIDHARANFSFFSLTLPHLPDSRNETPLANPVPRL